MRFSITSVLLLIMFIMLGNNALIGSELKRYTLGGYAQGTTYSISYYAEQRIVSESMIDSIVAVIDSSMSIYKPYSIITRINSGTDSNILLDDHFARVMQRSFEIYEDSKGVFDVTVAPLVELWGFGTRPQGKVPDSTSIADALSCVGMNKLSLSGNMLCRTDKCVQVDVNGIAQGYTVDVISNFLEQHNIAYYLVELGGELYVKGPKPDGSSMRIGIERPPVAQDSTSLHVQHIMYINEGAVTTAGNYRRFLQDGERKISHHINPNTGYSYQSGIISATIYAKDAITADGYDNVVMAMHADEAITFINERKDIEVYLIYQDENGILKEKMSEGFHSLLEDNTIPTTL